MKLIPLTLMLAITVVAALACTPITGSTSDCPACMAIAQIIKDYENNAIRAEQTHVGQRYNFSGKVNSISDSGKVPLPGRPVVPQVRVESGGKSVTFTFSYDYDNQWVFDLNKGDTIIANCLVKSLDSWGVIELGMPRLDECAEQR